MSEGIFSEQALAEIAVGEKRWEDAMALLKLYPDLAETVAVPRAQQLMQSGCHQEAYLMYKWVHKATENSAFPWHPF